MVLGLLVIDTDFVQLVVAREQPVGGTTSSVLLLEFKSLGIKEEETE